MNASVGSSAASFAISSSCRLVSWSRGISLQYRPRSAGLDARPDVRLRSGFHVPNQGGAMSEQNVELVQGTYDSFARGDVPAVLGAFADDIEWLEAEGMPYGGVYRGADAVVQNVFGPITEDVDGFALVIEQLIAS